MLGTVLRSPKETQVLAVVFLTVLVQVLVLSFFGHRALKGQEAEGERSAREFCRRVLDRNLVEELDRRIRDGEGHVEDLLGALRVDAPGEDAVLPLVLAECCGDDHLFARAFLLDRDGDWFDAAGELLVPSADREAVRPGGDVFSPFERIEADLAGGGSPEEALPRLRALLDRADAASRWRGLLLLAQIARRAGRPAEALQAWETLLAEYPRAAEGPDRPPLGPLAARQRIELLLAAVRAGGRPAQDLTDALLDLRRVLARNRSRLTGARAAWERDELRRLSEEAAPLLSAAERARLSDGIDRQEAEEEALATVRRLFGARLERAARGAAPGGRLRDSGRIVYAVPLRGGAGVSGVAALELDLERVRGVLLPELLSGLPLPEGVGATVLDPEGNPVVAATGRVEGTELVRVRLGEALPFWTPVAFLRDPGLVERRTEPARLLQIWTMALSITGILLAGWFVVRTVRRELRVAKMKSDFLSNVTHELKTPLTSIRMFVETLQEGRVRDEAERREYLDVIGRESERLSGLIQRVLDLARFEGKHKDALKRRPADPGAVVAEAAEIFRRRLVDADVAVEVRVADGLPSTAMDPEAVKEMLLNLLSNAEKYGGKRIVLGATAEDGILRLTVADDGIGIAEAEQSRIFEKFWRSDDHLAREVEGSGLGLALVREIARAHGGRVAVSSRRGEGSTFTVTLPVKAKE